MSSQAPITDPKQALTELLRKAGVTKVAYIDDKFSSTIQMPFFLGTLKEIYQSKQYIDKINFIDFWDVAYPVFEGKINSIWNEANDRQRNEYLRSLYSAIGDKDEFTNINAVIKLPDMAGDMIATYSPEAWMENKDSFFKQNITKKGERVICLFDKDLKSSRDGIELLKDVLTGDFKNKVYCAIISQHVSLGDEFISKKRWVDEFSLSKIANKFYPISKDTIKDDPVWGFIDGIKNVLIVEEVERLKRQSIGIIKKAQQKTIQEVQEIAPETYNQIIQRSSANEGVWEMNTLFRISNLIHDVSLKSSILSSEVRANFNSSISVIRSFEEIKFDQETIIESKQAVDLQEKEIFETGEVINSLHYALANGDIFLINNKEYILLSQPCNISIRPRGIRSNDYELATLVQIFGEDKDANSVRIKCQHKWVKFAANYSIKFDVLDLAVFNNDGNCKINCNQDLDDEVLFHFPLIERYQKLRKHYKKCAEQIIDLENILDKSPDKKAKYLPMLNPVVTINSKLRIPSSTFNKESQEFDFKIQRVARLKEPFSNDILQKFMLYQSRNAFEHDITKSYCKNEN
jgi:hypothetical protein